MRFIRQLWTQACYPIPILLLWPMLWHRWVRYRSLRERTTWVSVQLLLQIWSISDSSRIKRPIIICIFFHPYYLHLFTGLNESTVAKMLTALGECSEWGQVRWCPDPILVSQLVSFISETSWFLLQLSLISFQYSYQIWCCLNLSSPFRCSFWMHSPHTIPLHPQPQHPSLRGSQHVSVTLMLP